jgi:hypothetical protein
LQKIPRKQESVMTDEIRDSRPTDQTDAELSTADLAGTSQKTPRVPNQSPIETESHSAAAPRGAVSTERSRTGTHGAATAPALDQEAAPLFSGSEANDLRARWDAIQVGFVDQPRQAVEQADKLVAGTMKRLAEIFADERSTLEGQWDQGENVSTEDLRLGLRRYRSFFSRLLSL